MLISQMGLLRLFLLFLYTVFFMMLFKVAARMPRRACFISMHAEMNLMRDADDAAVDYFWGCVR